MADSSYQPSVYRKQGGTELVVASGGTLTVESGGQITIDSGGAMAYPVQTAASSATTITAMGVTIVTGTSDIPTYLMSNPLVGVPKWLIWTGTSGDGTTSIGAIVAAASTGVTFDTSGQHKLTLESSGLRGVSLIGLTTARWGIVGTKYQADVAITT